MQLSDFQPTFSTEHPFQLAFWCFKKCREHPDDILFIDASQHYEKVKTQNYLRDEDVDRIVDTYAKRITIDKYSYVASLDEVRENDYNLNIPRYVDTFEEEEPVDIACCCH
ncbi:MAG: SAM-dependent methyltransferase [Marinilabiliales bacterium]|nr:SAM-dependent methyltransferase [Marinilabiliales bacterium]